MTFFFFFFFKRCARLIIDTTGNSSHLLNHQSVFRDDAHVLQENCWLFSTFSLFIVPLENRTRVISHQRSLAGLFVPGSVPFFITSHYFMFCLGHLDTKHTKQRLQPLWLGKMFISKCCFSNRSKWHIVISAQLTGAMSFISRFCLGLLV